MRLAFSTNAYLRHPFDVAAARIAALGYEGLELLADVPHAWPAGLLDVQNGARRWFWPTRQFPSESLKKAACLWRIWIVETPAIKVLWKFSIGHTFPSPFNSNECQTAPANTEEIAVQSRKG